MRGESSTLFLVFMTILGLAFAFLALLMFRFDLIGGDVVDENIRSPIYDTYNNLSRVLLPRKIDKEVLLEENEGDIEGKNKNNKQRKELRIGDKEKEYKIVKPKKVKRPKSARVNSKIQFKDTTSAEHLNFKSKQRFQEFIRAIIISFYPSFLMNYDLYFFIASLIGLGSLNCRNAWIKGGLSKITTNSNYLQNNGIEI